MLARLWSKDIVITRKIVNTLHVLILRLKNVGEILVQFTRLELAQSWKEKLI